LEAVRGWLKKKTRVLGDGIDGDIFKEIGSLERKYKVGLVDLVYPVKVELY
jgi:hypothetical protein